jgi:hypothetical protein
MKRILAILALASFVPAAALAVPYTTTGGYGTPVLDSSGASYVNTDSLKSTYAFQGTDLTPYATAQDYIVLTGSATKTLKLAQVCFGGDATAASIYDIYLYKRTTPDTGGTATSQTLTQYDSNDPAPTGVVSLYTVAPTAGTGTLIRGGHMVLLNATTPAAQSTLTCWQFGVGEEKPTLRGVNQQIAINHGGAAVPGGASSYYLIEWTEE